MLKNHYYQIKNTTNIIEDVFNERERDLTNADSLGRGQERHYQQGFIQDFRLAEESITPYFQM